MRLLRLPLRKNAVRSFYLRNFWCLLAGVCVLVSFLGLRTHTAYTMRYDTIQYDADAVGR